MWRLIDDCLAISSFTGNFRPHDIRERDKAEVDHIVAANVVAPVQKGVIDWFDVCGLTTCGNHYVERVLGGTQEVTRGWYATSLKVLYASP